MEEWLGLICKINIVQGGKNLFFTAKIIGVSDSHITFIDKYDSKFTYRLLDVVKIREVEDEN